MRIAILAHSNAAWTPHYARYFAEAGYPVRVFSYTPEPLAGVEVVHLTRRLPHSMKLLRFLLLVPRARRSLREFRPDVVLATYLSSNGMTAALAWHGPLVVSARGGDVLRQAGYLPAPEWAHRRMVRFVCHRAAEVHSVSEEVTRALVACGIPRERIQQFPMGVDLQRFAFRPARERSDVPRIVCTRRHDAVYANDVVVEALQRLRQQGHAFRAKMIGGGPLLEARRQQVARLGLGDWVELCGEVAHEAMPGLLAEADIYVSASLSDGTSSSLLEALAVGLFPVVTRIPANLPWVEERRTGLLWAPGDAGALAEALAAAIALRPLWPEAAARNRERVAQEGDQRRNLERMHVLLKRAVLSRRIHEGS